MTLSERSNLGAPLGLRVLVSLVLAAPLLCQSELQPYFSLSTDRTFGSAETPTIALAGTRVPAVQIRVYRVKDPLEFYRRIESPHNFGQQEQQKLQKKSFLGSLRSWKHDLRRQIRVFLRDQFTESVSAHLKRPVAVQKGRSAETPAEYFAATPVLNRDQLVLSFVQALGTQPWSSVTVPIQVKDKGVYLVEAVHGGLRAYTILVKSNLVAVTKVGRERIVAFVVDRTSGQPVSGAKLAVMKRDAAPATFQTNADGIADVRVPGATSESSDELRIVASKDNDVTLQSVGLWNFGDAARSWTGYIYTDRPVYRPRDTIHFRGILRMAKAQGGYTSPQGQSFAVQIQDPDGKQVYTQHLTANSNGIVHGEFTSGRTAALGNYYIQITSGDTPMTGNFEIQEYKKPEYEVRVTPAKARVLEGDGLDATINARYYFGEPVKNAKVEYSVYRSRYFPPLWEDPDEAESGAQIGDPSDDDAGEEVLRAHGQLDGDGQLSVHYRTTVSDHGNDYRYRIEARVTDEARREISGTGWAIATYGTFLVNVQPQQYFYEPSGQAELAIKAMDYDGKPVSTPVKIELIRPARKPGQPGKVVSTASASTGSDGTGKAQLEMAAEGGMYRVRVSALSGNGRQVEDTTYLWIAGGGSATYGGGNAHRVAIVPDKKKYAAGETAKFLVISGEPNTPVLVTLEGRDVRLVKLLRSNTATVSFDYKVMVSDEPGFFVTAQFVRNGEMHQGQKRVIVPPEQHKLSVDVTTDKQTYPPGQTATYTLKVTTPEGKPVPTADFSLGVVDEAIYAIRPDTTPDLLTYFYGNEGNNVTTLDSLAYYFNGEAGNRRMMLAMNAATQTPLAQIKREQLVQPKVRKFFPDTSYWAADLTTDQNGRATARVTYPDSLTTWRATAKGVVAAGERFGGAVEKTVVRKNVILRLAIPRFFVQGDETVISGIVHNYLPEAKHAKVSASLAGLTLMDGAAAQEVDIPSRGDAAVNWRVTTGAALQAKITASALTNEESDAVEQDVPIHPQGVKIDQPQGGSLSAGTSWDGQLTFPSDAEAASRSMSIRLASSAAGPIFQALEFLTSFPYGCVEQTMSSFLPNLMVRRAMRSVSGLPPVDQARLDEQVKAGLERIYGMQHEDGGWGWWPSDASQAFMTAYVVAGLAEARAESVAIQADSLKRGVAWLHTEIVRDAELEPDMRAYLAYALAEAGAPDSALDQRVFAERTTLSPYGTALLGLAFEKVKDARAKTLAGVLEGSVKQTGEEARWEAMRDEMLDFEADVSPEATAYAVKLLTHENPKSPLLPKAILWLVNHRNEGYWWSSSKQTAMVIYGVLDYLKQSNELTPDFTAAVKVNGQQVRSEHFSAGSPVDAPELLLNESQLRSGMNDIAVETTGKGRLYYSVTGTHYSNAARMEKQGAISLNVLRDYFRLVPSKDGDHIVYDLAPLSGPVAPGDTLAVRLTVTGSDWKYLLAEDPIPAGTEFIERDNLYQLRSRPPWWQYTFTRRELHDDRMAIFQTYFSQGQQQYFYLLKVVNPGLFHVGPARVAPMYQAGIRATSESRTLEVVK